jgi:NRPS condensation-like uncharacterized protein
VTAERLTADRRRLLDSWLRGRPPSRTQQTPGPAVAVTADRTQTSAAQQRVWLMDQLSATPVAQNVCSAWRIAGTSLDTALLAEALAVVGRRHEILRTRYVESGGELRQRVWSGDVPLAWHVDLTARPPAVARAQAVRAMRADLLRPFDFTTDPPRRLGLCRLGPQEQVLYACFHHIAVDGPSLELFWRDLSRAYAARADGGSLPASTRLQYVDYAA